MEELFSLVVVVSFFAMVLGMFSPRLVIHWGNEEKKTRGKVLLVYGCVFLFSFIVLGIAFWLPGKIDFETFLSSALTGYTFKLSIAILLTPVIYAGHHLIKKFLSDADERINS